MANLQHANNNFATSTLDDSPNLPLQLAANQSVALPNAGHQVQQLTCHDWHLCHEANPCTSSHGVISACWGHWHREPMPWATCNSNHNLPHKLHPCQWQGFRWSWLPMQADIEGFEPGHPSSAEQLYALQSARKEEQRMELERLGLDGPFLQGNLKRPQSSNQLGGGTSTSKLRPWEPLLLL
jgi:hypothetical protein